MKKHIEIFIITAFLLFTSTITLGQPKIEFDSLDYTMNSVKRGERLKIPFKNIGNRPLIITSAHGAGTPSVTRPQEPILPNSTGYIDFAMPTNFVGTTTQPIFINTNIDDKIIVLTIKLKVIEDTLKDDKVFGKVTGEDGLPLQNVTIQIEGTHRGTITNKDGDYTIIANQNQYLVFTYTDMKFQRISAYKNEINVKLQKSDAFLQNSIPIPTNPRSPRERYGPNITVKDLNNANNPRYDFRVNAKKNVFVIFVSELTSYDFNQVDKGFQERYKILYSLTGNHNIEYLKKYNKLTFKHLNKIFKNSWQTEIRKDAIGLNDYIR